VHEAALYEPESVPFAHDLVCAMQAAPADTDSDWYAVTDCPFATDCPLNKQDCEVTADIMTRVFCDVVHPDRCCADCAPEKMGKTRNTELNITAKRW
jgi:hypothetical protein